MLELEEFKTLPHNKTFATGVINDGPTGINMTGSEKTLRWIAKKGGIDDWTVYCHWDYHSQEFVEQSGDKVNFEENIRKCVPCSDEVLKLYRH